MANKKRGFGQHSPSENQVIREGVKKLISQLKNSNKAFRRNMAAAIWNNDIGALTRYMKELALEASIDFVPIGKKIIRSRKIEGFAEQAFNKELEQELNDMR